MGYLLSKNYQESGPYEIGSLQDMIKSGQIGEDHWVCKEGSKDWVEAKKLPELKAAFGKPAKPKSAQPDSSSVKKEPAPKAPKKK